MAVGAEVAAAVSDGKALDGCVTGWAWLAASVSHAEVGMRSAQFAIWAFIGVNAGAFAING